MKIKLYILLSLLCCGGVSLMAQNTYTVRLKSRAVTVIANPNLAQADFEVLQNEQARGAAKSDFCYTAIQFSDLPNAEQVGLLSANGVQLLQYIGGNAYYCAVEPSRLTVKPQSLQMRAIVPILATDKMAKPLLLNDIPAYSKDKGSKLLLRVLLQKTPKGFNTADNKTNLEQNGFELQPATPFDTPESCVVRLDPADLNRLAELPFVAYIETLTPPASERNQRSRAAINSAFVSRPSGLNLTGSGIIVGIGDGGDISHLDYNNRTDRKSGQPYSAHATHVSGTILGSGLMNPRYKGNAPGVPLLISDYFDAIISSTPSYITNFNMSLTNNSWSASANDCSTFGIYTAASNYTDAQLYSNPSLLHVFAAGNSGAKNCISGNYATLAENFQVSKNVLTVANTLDDQTISSSSSRGPTADGRLKPEISAIGTNVTSTGINNGTTQEDSYFTISGTSMATPAITGGLALLSERYKTLNGVLPDGALLKAVAMNTAKDLGNTGPDYTFGFGWLDVRRAEQTITNNTIFTNTIAQGATQTHNITVPAGASALKVLLYWSDPEGAPISNPALVNNLDLNVVTPSSSVVLPWILDPLAPANIATQGIDNINNQEQVTINMPANGIYTLTVNGTSVPVAAPQKYYLVYEIVQPAITVLYPSGEEQLNTGETEIIRWEATDNSANTFTVEYTTNGGGAWTLINNSVAATERQLSWTLPTGVASDLCRIRVTRNITLDSDESDANFTIMGVPVVTLNRPCVGYVTVSWGAIAGATTYEIFSINRQNGSITSIGTSAGTSFATSGGLNTAQTYYFAVTARTATATSRRSVAKSIIPSSGNCAAAIYNNNLELSRIVVNNGRKFTSSSLSATQNIVFRIKNRDNAAFNNSITATYQINGGATVSQTFPGVNVAVNDSTTLTFSTTADLSAVNNYTILASINPTGDTELSNNTATKTVRQVDNPVRTLPYSEGFETTNNATYQISSFALAGNDALDYNTLSTVSQARLRTKVLPNLAHNGTNALTMDALLYQNTTSAQEVILSTNLSAVTGANLRMDFFFQQHKEEAQAGDMVWIRGNDTAPWLVAYDLFANQGAADTYIAATAIDIKSILTAGGQAASSSFQVKFGQQGNLAQSVNPESDGYTFDDVKIYDLQTDLAIKSIDSPVSCASSAGNTVSVTLQNTALTNIIGASVPITYTITPPTGAPTSVTEMATITLNAGTSTPFSFATAYNFNQIGDYSISVSINFTDDITPNNSLTEKRGLNQGTISVFPYIEGFESGTANWFHSGTNDDWTLGTPAKTFISKAANGTKAWTTKTTGSYSASQDSYLFTPCFDLTTLTNPMLSFSFIYDIEFCGNPNPCDFIVLQYSLDGKTWAKLGTQGASGSTNWHNDAVQAWSNFNNYWEVASLPIPNAARSAATRFRFVFHSDSGVEYEGVAIDDFSVFEQQAIFSGANTTVTQNISGAGWIDFASGGNMIAQINPQGNNLGNTDVKTFIFGGALRNNTTQYYMDRNLVITPANAPVSPVKVRIFFLKTEIDELINASGCGTCSVTTDPYVLGVTKFSNGGIYENGDITDNFGNGTSTFILPQNTLIQPYNNGYYAEFEVSSFSEFWLNDGGANATTPLPVELTKFEAYKQNNDALLKWTTATEKNTLRFEVESSTENLHFKKIGEIRAIGNSNTTQNYQFTDETANKNGVYYYRLRMVDADNSYTYSPVRSLRFRQTATETAVYPNPTAGSFKLVFVSDDQTATTITLANTLGQIIATQKIMGNGTVQNLIFDDLTSQNMPSGTYFITLLSGEKIETLRLVKILE